MNKSLFSKFLKYYSLTEEDFSSFCKLSSMSSLVDPRDNPNFNKVISKLKKLVEENRKILVYGDYDFDGISSTTILVYSLKKIGCKNVNFYIPNRYLDGYGLLKKHVDNAINKNYDCIITIDNGISKYEEIKYAKENGIEVIVVDHHLKLESNQKLETEYVFHQFESGLTEYNISAAFLSLFLSYGLLNYYDPYLVSLAGLAVLSDSMPLVGMNITLVKNMIKYIREYQFPNLVYLVKNFSSLTFSQTQASFDIVGIINGCSRIIEDYSINQLVSYLLETDLNEIKLISKQLININDIKKKIVNNTFNQIPVDNKKYQFSIVDTKLGLSGLIAGRLLSKKDVVGIFISKDSDKYIASLRSKAYIDLIQIISKYKDLLLEFGGHKNACGLTIYKNKYDEFIKQLSQDLENCLTDEHIESKPYIDINPNDINEELVQLIEQFGPYNDDKKAPLFELILNKNNIHTNINSDHIIFYLNDRSKLVYFNSKENVENLLSKKSILSFYGEVSKECFNNTIYYQFMVKDVE